MRVKKRIIIVFLIIVFLVAILNVFMFSEMKSVKEIDNVLSTEERQRFLDIVNPIIENKRVQQMKDYIQHGDVTTFEHVYRVAYTCYYLNHKYKLGIDDEELVMGAMLHDFYLYDWHEEGGDKLHGYHHPEIASKNAKEEFDVNDNVMSIIKSHMWPLTLTKIPTSKAALLVCLVDKYVSTSETFDGFLKVATKNFKK